MTRPASFQGFTRPGRLIPEWRVQFLVFQGGNPRQRAGSLTGGGQIYGHEFGSSFIPVNHAYATPVTNLVGGGQINSRPAFLSLLFGGRQGSGA